MPPIRSKAPQWGRIAIRVAAGLAIALVAVYFAASYALNRYLQGDAFRALLGEKTSALLRAEGRYEPIQNNGFSFYSDGYTARGLAGSPIKALKADQIRAEFQPVALFQGAWKVDAVQIQHLKLDLGGPASAAAAAPADSDATAVARTASPQSDHGSNAEPGIATLPSFAAAPDQQEKSCWIPNRFELRQAKIEEAELAWRMEIPVPRGPVAVREGTLGRSRLILEPAGRDLLVTGYGGTLAQAGLPTLTVDHFKLRCHFPQVYLTDGQLMLGDGQSLDLSGQADLGAARSFDFLAKYSGINISPYLPEDWRAGVKGQANGEARITGNGGAVQAEGTLALTGGQLEALPILEKIAAFTHTREFRQFALQKAEADYVWTPAKLTVSRLEAESQGLIRISGRVVVENGEAQGDFQLGVTPSSLKWLPGSRDRVFTQEHDGYAWTTLKVSGPLNHLSEDLTARLTAAAGEQLIQEVKGNLQNGAKSLFDLIKSHLQP